MVDPGDEAKDPAGTRARLAVAGDRLERARALLVHAEDALAAARARIETLESQLGIAVTMLIGRGAPLEEIGPRIGGGDWDEIARGGNNRPGIMGGVGECPCQHVYTVATNQAVINAWPNPAQVNACAANPPAPENAMLRCSDDCVPVRTHVWHGWTVVRNRRTGQLKFNCHTYAQYHCKKPDDPHRDDPPIPTDPNDPMPEA